MANGVVYVGSGDTNVYALNATTGALQWSYRTGDLVASSPAVANGIVYIGSDDDNVYALNSSTGALMWKYTTGLDVGSSPAVANGVVYIGSGDTNVYALNATTGALLWQYTTLGNSIGSSPAVANGWFTSETIICTLSTSRSNDVGDLLDPFAHGVSSFLCADET